jgi:hypothetical protein
MERCLWEAARKAAVPSFGVLRRDRTDRLRSGWGPPREKTAPNGSTRGTLVYTSLSREAKTEISGNMSCLAEGEKVCLHKQLPSLAMPKGQQSS